MKQSISLHEYLLPVVTLMAALASTRAPAQSQQFYSLTPCRVVDTRTGNGGTIPAAIERTFQIKTICGVPFDAKTITMNLTGISPSQTGFITMWPTGGAYTGTSVLNVSAGQLPIANGVIMKLGAGSPDLSVAYGTCCGSGTIDIVIDVFGYYK